MLNSACLPACLWMCSVSELMVRLLDDVGGATSHTKRQPQTNPGPNQRPICSGGSAAGSGASQMPRARRPRRSLVDCGGRRLMMAGDSGAARRPGRRGGGGGRRGRRAGRRMRGPAPALLPSGPPPPPPPSDPIIECADRGVAVATGHVICLQCSADADRWEKDRNRSPIALAK